MPVYTVIHVKWNSSHDARVQFHRNSFEFIFAGILLLRWIPWNSEGMAFKSGAHFWNCEMLTAISAREMVFKVCECEMHYIPLSSAITREHIRVTGWWLHKGRARENEWWRKQNNSLRLENIKYFRSRWRSLEFIHGNLSRKITAKNSTGIWCDKNASILSTTAKMSAIYSQLLLLCAVLTSDN